LFLSRFGQVDVIDYRNKYNENSMRVIRECKSYDGFKSAVKDVFRAVPRRRLIQRFEQFIADKFNLAPVDSVKEYNVYVAGSDQIWNPNIVSDGVVFDDVYFLRGCNGIKVSMASSFGGYNLSHRNEGRVKELLNDYTAISVRESGAAVRLAETLGREVVNVLDPTLLLSKKEWSAEFEIEVKPEQPYILVYALKKCSEFYKIVEMYRRSMGIKVIVIDQDPSFSMFSSNYIMDAGPIEFLELFYNARFVITNSFHGVAFSVNFEVPFIAVKPVHSSNRVTDFLETVDLLGRYVTDSSPVAALLGQEVNFDSSRNILSTKRRDAAVFLGKSMC